MRSGGLGAARDGVVHTHGMSSGCGGSIGSNAWKGKQNVRRSLVRVVLYDGAMSRARTIGISFVFGTGSKAAISRSRSVIRPALLPAGNLLEWLSKRLDGSQFYRTARIDGISILLGFNYGTYKTSRYVRRVYRRPGRAGRQLDLAFDIDGNTVASMTSERFREEFAWGLLDVLIDAGAGMKADVNELARLRAKFRAPFQSRLFAGVLGDYVDSPEPVDPFKYELELTVPLRAGGSGT
jgi:hypothetical protein